MFKLFVYTNKHTVNLDFLPKREWHIMYNNSAENLLQNLYRFNKKDIIVLIRLPIAEDLITLIQKIRQFSFTPGIIIYDSRKYYNKAYTCLKLGACSYIHERISRNKLHNTITMLRDNLLYPKKWLNAFLEDNVWSRNALHTNKQLITYKLNSQLKQKYSPNFIHQHTSDSIFSRLSNDKHDLLCNKDLCLNVIEDYLSCSIQALAKQKIYHIGDSSCVDNLMHPYLKIIQKDTDSLQACFNHLQEGMLLLSVPIELIPKHVRFWIKHAHIRTLYILNKKSIESLNTLFQLGINDVHTIGHAPTFEKQLFSTWLSYRFPYYYKKMELNMLSFSQRICFFEFLFQDSKKKGKSLSQLDIFSLFPELLRIPQNNYIESTQEIKKTLYTH